MRSNFLEVSVIDEDFLDGSSLIMEKLRFRNYRTYKKYAKKSGFKICKHNKLTFERYYYNLDTKLIRGVEKLEVL